MSPGAPGGADRFSATRLLHLSARLQRELAACLQQEVTATEGVPTLSLEADVRLESARQRADFADALQKAVTDVIGRHTAPAHDEKGRPGPGREYRLVVGCYPVPQRDGEHPTPTVAEPEGRRE
jgi:hypothetical protein